MKKAAIRVKLTHLAVAIPLMVAMTQAVQAQTPAPTFSKAFNPSTIGPAAVSTLRFDITNSAQSTVDNLAFTDALPTGVVIATPANATSTCEGELSAPDGGTTITFGDGRVGAAGSCSVTVDMTSSFPGTHTNVSGDLTSSAGNSGAAQADLIVATDRPGFSKSFSPSTVAFGGRSTLTFAIDNTANNTLASQLLFTDGLPPGMVVADPANVSNTCNAGSFTGGVVTAVPGTSVVSLTSRGGFDVGAVDPGSSCTISVDVIGGAVGQLFNISGELTSSVQFGPARSSGKASATLTATSDQISLVKSFTDDPVPPGGTVTLEFTILNLNRRFGASSIAFTDDLDAVLQGLAASSLPQNPCGSGSVITGTSNLTLSGGALGPEESCTFSVGLQVPQMAASGSFTNTTSEISAEIDGSPVTGSPATDLLFVSPAPILTKSFIGDPVGAGASVDLGFTITNTSPTSDATDMSFEDQFDVVLPDGSSVPGNGFCGSGSTATFTPLINPPPPSSAIPARLSISGASLGPGESCSFSMTLDVAVGAANGTYTNTTSSPAATVDGETVVGNPATDDLVIVAGPSLIKEFADDPVAPGDTVTLEFTLAHDAFAPGDATAISFTDNLDAALSGLVATGLPLADVCGAGSEIAGTQTLTFSGGSLVPGDSCTFSVTLQVPADSPIGRHPNTTSNVVATVDGVETTGNAASDNLEIAGLTLTKEFTDDPVLAGATVNLRFTVENVSADSSASNIIFEDDLNEVIDGLVATVLPPGEICGTGSSLIGAAVNTVLYLQNGSLAANESCTFDVTLQVPAGAASDTYVNRTSGFSATIDGSTVFFDNASDDLIVNSDVLEFTKEFIDDPVSPGGTATLRFTLNNLLGSQAVTELAFEDDLDAALAGLTSSSGTLTEVCGAGSQITGSSHLSFTGGSLAASESCSFDVSLSIPTGVQPGTVAINTTGELTGTVDGLGVTGPPAIDELRFNFLEFSKSFDDPAEAGGTTDLSFTIRNLSDSESVVGLTFSDDLTNVLPGLAADFALGTDVCGPGSVFAGTTFLTLLDGSLLPNGSCTFSVELQIPASAAGGDYENVTSELLQFGVPVAAPATDTLTVFVDLDLDDDGVLDSVDVCPETWIPEGVPTVRLGTNRYALVDDDLVFDTASPAGRGPGEVFTTEDTAGCSCEQIIEAQDLGGGHTKFGCSLGEMREWVTLVNSKRGVRRAPGTRQ